MASSADEVEVSLGDGNSFKVHLHGMYIDKCQIQTCRIHSNEC